MREAMPAGVLPNPPRIRHVPEWRALALLGSAGLLMLQGCALLPKRWGARPCCLEAKPQVKRQPIAWHLFDVTVLEPLEQPFHLMRWGRKLFGIPIRASNLQGDQVADSAFFTDRDLSTLSVKAARWGPTDPDEAATPPFTITKAKLEGKTPGFFVRDARGHRYLLKFDPVDAPELLSGAEVVTSKLLHALGYRVPSYEVVFLRPEDVRIAEANETQGTAAAVTPAALEELMEPRLREGRVRVAASHILDGEILGPASFKQFRDCAEMRALRLAYAWLNNVDAKDHNSLLVWDGQRTVGYLIDFGTSLGADAGRGAPKESCEGWTYAVDLQEWSLRLVTLGWHRPVCEAQPRVASPSIGLFSPQFDPERWKPYAPNLAFLEMNDDDARWIARRMARLSRAHLEAAVSAGQYQRPEDAAYLVEALEQRRWAIVRRYGEEE
jgi:hypothetical protein